MQLSRQSSLCSRQRAVIDQVPPPLRHQDFKAQIPHLGIILLSGGEFIKNPDRFLRPAQLKVTGSFPEQRPFPVLEIHQIRINRRQIQHPIAIAVKHSPFLAQIDPDSGRRLQRRESHAEGFRQDLQVAALFLRHPTEPYRGFPLRAVRSFAEPGFGEPPNRYRSRDGFQDWIGAFKQRTGGSQRLLGRGRNDSGKRIATRFFISCASPARKQELERLSKVVKPPACSQKHDVTGRHREPFEGKIQLPGYGFQGQALPLGHTSVV